MMRRGIAGVIGIVVGIGAQPAAAQDRSETYHIVCVSQDTPARIAYGADVISEKFATYQEARARFDEVKRRFEAQTKRAGQGNYRTCKMVTDERLATDSWDREVFEGYQVGSRYELAFGEGWVSVVRADIPKNWANIPAPGESASKGIKESENGGQKADQASIATKGDTAREAAEERKKAALEAEKARVAAREAREAEFQAKLAAHEAEVAEYQRKVKAREDEIARQQQELAANAAEAARKKATHARLIEEHMKRQMDYEAARNRHTLCVNGNAQACAEIDAGKPATAEKLADAGKAQTSDDEARMCVTDPVLGPSKVWKGALAATIVNGCMKPIDARICLLREGGWNCGVYWGLKPQQPWTWTSFKATGDLFWDARIAGTGRPLASPE